MAHFIHIDSAWCTCHSCQTRVFSEMIDGMPKFFQGLLLPGALAIIGGLIGIAIVFIVLVLEIGWKYHVLGQETVRWLTDKSVLMGVSGVAWVVGVIVLYFAYEILAAIGRLMCNIIRWLSS